MHNVQNVHVLFSHFLFLLFFFFFFISFNASTSFSSKFMDIVLLTDLHASLLFFVSSLVRLFAGSMFPSPFVMDFSVRYRWFWLCFYTQNIEVKSPKRRDPFVCIRCSMAVHLFDNNLKHLKPLPLNKSKVQAKIISSKICLYLCAVCNIFPIYFPFFFALFALPFSVMQCVARTNVCKFHYFSFEIAESSATKNDPLTCWNVERLSYSV